jgi:ABC-type uncharacterized transport system involved in gliding motility auxiliary subunit
VALKRREDLDARTGIDLARHAKSGLGSLLYTLSVLTALGLVLALGVRLRSSWDFTRQSVNSLSPKSVAALDALTDTITIHALYGRKDPRRDSYWELLNLYRSRSPHVSVEFVDPNTHPGVVAQFGLSTEDRAALKQGLTVITRGTKRIAFRGRSEEEITNAILELGSDAPRVVGLVRGVGERDPASSADDGFASAVAALREEYYDVVDVRLDAPIPPQVKVLIAAGPRAAIGRAEVDRLIRWLEAGGRFLLLVDGGTDSGLTTATARFGLRTKPIRILDRAHNLRGSPEVVLATDFARHPIVRGFSASLPLALPLPVAVEDFEPGDPAVLHAPLVHSSGYSEGLTFDGVRKAGPFCLAAAASRALPGGGGGETRVVLVGDAAFATNAFLPEQANRDFFLNVVGWLSRARGFIAVREKPLAGQQIVFRRSDLPVFRLMVLGPPVLIVLVGAIVYLRRRRL